MRNQLITLFLLLFTSSAWGASVYVGRAEFRGALDQDADLVTDLLKNAVAKTSGFVEADSAAKAQITLTSRLMKLGSSYLLSVRRTDGARPAAELKVATLDDMHLATQRLVRTVLTGATEAPRVGEVTVSDEVANERRVQATRQFQLAFGPTWTSNLNNSGPASTWSLGYLWGIEYDYEIALRGEFLSASQARDASFGGVSIGLNYFLTRTRFAPFVGADFGYGWASADRGCGTKCKSEPADENNGWQIGASAGYKFFRTASVNLALLVQHEVMMATLSRGNPSKTAFKIALYF